MSSPGVRWPRRGTPVLPLGGATNEVLTKLSGLDYDWGWAAGGGGGGGGTSFPTSPVTGAHIHLAADLGLSLADGDPVGTWSDQTTNGHHFVSSGSARPTFRAQDGSDGLPFIEFDGSDDYLLTSAVPSPASPGNTVYAVVRVGRGGSYPGFASFSTVSGNDYDNDGSISFEYGNSAPYSPYTTRNNTVTNRPYDFKSDHDDSCSWGIFVSRWRSVMGYNISTALWTPGWRTSRNWSSTPNFTYTHVSLGARRNGGGMGNYGRSDQREWIVYTTGHTDKEMAANIRYLADKWSIPLAL